MLEARDIRRLQREGRARKIAALTVRALAPEALGVVEPLVAAAIIQQRLEAEFALEHLPSGRERRLIAWRGVSAKLGAVAYEHLVQIWIGIVREEPVLVLVLITGDRTRPQTADGISDDDTRRVANLRRRIPEAFHLVRIERTQEADVPPECLRVDWNDVQLQLDARVAHGAKVGGLARDNSVRGGHDGGDQRVLGALAIDGRVYRQAAMKQLRLEPSLELAAALRFEIRVSQAGEGDRRDVGVIDVGGARRVELQRVRGARLYARLAVRGPQAQRCHP